MKISELITELNKIKDKNEVLNSKKENKKVLKLFWQS